MTTANSTRQYRRVCQVITGIGGNGISIDQQFKIEIKITKTAGRTPNVANIKIYNLSPATEGRIKGEFDEVLLNVGYDGAAILVFRGNIRHADAYKADTNRILELDCADGDRDFRNAIVNTTLAAGTSTQQVLDHVVSKFTTTTKGTIVIKDRQRTRGRVLCGMARDVLDGIAAEHDAHWSIQDGQLQIVPVDSVLPTEAIVITSETGMLSAPERTDKGIKVRCLMNPRIKPNGKIWLNNQDFKDRVAAVHAKAPGAKPHSGPKKAPKTLARVSPDGTYKVIRVDHEGDTRAEKWESEIICVALPTTVTPAKTPQK